MRWSERIILNTVLLGIVHFAVMISCMWMSYGSHAARRDATFGESVSGTVAYVLLHPFAWIPSDQWDEFPGPLLFFGNSLLWGFVLALLIRRLRRRSAVSG